jgi:hypothetical protein
MARQMIGEAETWLAVRPRHARIVLNVVKDLGFTRHEFR